MNLKDLKGLVNQLADVISKPLAIINLVANVLFFTLVEVKHWQYLSVVWHKCLTDHLS